MYMELIARLNTYRPRLSIGGELEGSTINGEEQALKVGELSGRKAEQASPHPASHRTRGRGTQHTKQASPRSAS